MLHTLIWDSEFFGKKIGEIHIDPKKLSNVPSVVQKAKNNGFEYIICRLHEQRTSVVKALQLSGFYLSDIGVTWHLDADNTFREIEDKDTFLDLAESIRIAKEYNIPSLQKMITSLFTTSRFYDDPFFSRHEANKLYRKWIENSITGKAADIVFFIPNIGLITCLVKNDQGEIALIGVKKSARGRGIGVLLLKTALEWFLKNDIYCITARTQLKNTSAMNFYRKLGFIIKGYDLIFSKML